MFLHRAFYIKLISWRTCPTVRKITKFFYVVYIYKRMNRMLHMRKRWNMPLITRTCQRWYSLFSAAFFKKDWINVLKYFKFNSGNLKIYFYFIVVCNRKYLISIFFFNEIFYKCYIFILGVIEFFKIDKSKSVLKFLKLTFLFLYQSKINRSRKMT